jgi:hypothetical protein
MWELSLRPYRAGRRKTETPADAGEAGLGRPRKRRIDNTLTHDMFRVQRAKRFQLYLPPCRNSQKSRGHDHLLLARA